MSLLRRRMAVSTPRRRIERQTPAKGSPDLKVTRRMSPGLGTSGLEREKRRWREPVGSRTVREDWVRAAMGKGWLLAAEGGGG